MPLEDEKPYNVQYGAELEGVAYDVLNNGDIYLAKTKQVTEALGLHIVDEHVHRFSPQGLTLALILAESHWMSHTWPETGHAFIDISLCSKTVPLHYLRPLLIKTFRPTGITVGPKVFGPNVSRITLNPDALLGPADSTAGN